MSDTETHKAMALAIRYTLDRAQESPDFRHHMLETRTLELLCEAEALMTGRPEADVIAERSLPLGDSLLELPGEVTLRRKLDRVEHVLALSRERGLTAAQTRDRIQGALRWWPRMTLPPKIFSVHTVTRSRALWYRLNNGPGETPGETWWTDMAVALLLRVQPPLRGTERNWGKMKNRVPSLHDSEGTLGESYAELDMHYRWIVWGDAPDERCALQQQYADLLGGCEIRCLGQEDPVAGYIDGRLVVLAMPTKEEP